MRGWIFGPSWSILAESFQRFDCSFADDALGVVGQRFQRCNRGRAVRTDFTQSKGCLAAHRPNWIAQEMY